MAKRRAGSRTQRKTARTKRPTKKRPAKKRPAKAPANWNPSRFALWSQRWGDPNNDNQTYPTTVLLRHPTAPFTVTKAGAVSEHDLKKTAHAYLTAANSSNLVNPSLNLPQEWLDALDPDHPGGDPSFGWLPFTSPTTDSKALLSFWARRTNGPRRNADSIVILLASQSSGPGFGIRVVAHVRKLSRSQSQVSISGMSASIPFGIFRPTPLPRALTRTARAQVRRLNQKFLNFLTKDRSFRNLISSTHGLDGTLAVQGVRLSPINPGQKNVIRLYGEVNATGQKSSNASAPLSVRREPYYSFIFATELTMIGPNISPSPPALLSKTVLVADAGPARVFPIDPASQAKATNLHHRRPTRRAVVLDYYRVTVPRLPSRPTPLTYAPNGYPDDIVFVCPGFVLEDYGLAPATPKAVDLPGGGPPIRSNDSSAVMAYWNVKELFDRLNAYGLAPNTYFRIAPLPLEVYYRSGIPPGPGKDGQTVNARISVKGFPPNFEGPVPKGSIIEMHLALADLSTRARKRWDGKHRSPAVPLGIAADARWIWHEIGHVLLTTSVGELQFRFAHSPGDALAAIVMDPESELATDANWRGATFPWVFLPRRHDRCVAHGWSWGGTLHHALSQVPNSAGPRRKAYWSEQILSSSLFRLYRCIGGDTTTVGSPRTPDPHARRSASHYCVYLIMRGIQILGTSLVVPANDPDQLVSALIDADINTASSTPWQFDFRPLFPPSFAPAPPDTFDRVGGCVHKVIRWAFETQGLYNPFGKITNAPGAPPSVDVYIDDRRPNLDNCAQSDYIAYGRGSYNPVSLEWDPTQTQASPTPAWQATDHAIDVQGNNVTVRVGNRGTQVATGVTVQIWWCPWPAHAAPPKWNDGAAGWNHSNISPPQNINAPGEGHFAFVEALPATRYIIVAKASCGDDLANTDVPTLPCSYRKTPLVDLVSGDNNIGLRVIGQ
jgi:hypothetical protein